MSLMTATIVSLVKSYSCTAVGKISAYIEHHWFLMHQFVIAELVLMYVIMFF